MVSTSRKLVTGVISATPPTAGHRLDALAATLAPIPAPTKTIFSSGTFFSFKNAIAASTSRVILL